jgi:hypothetical protein
VAGFSSFAAALLLFAQLKTNFGLTGRASPAPRTIPSLGRDDPAHFAAPGVKRAIASRQSFSARGEGSAPQRRRRVQARSAPEPTRAAM